jgi:hypothetical protein
VELDLTAPPRFSLGFPRSSYCTERMANYNVSYTAPEISSAFDVRNLEGVKADGM